MYIKNFFIFLILIIVVGCGSSTTQIKENVEAKWINNPPADNAKYFYALGYGKTQKEAKNDALSVVSSKISVNISSSFSNVLTVIQNDEEEDVLRETKSDVTSKSKDIQYTNVKIVKSKKSNLGWVVLVEVDKNILLKEYERKLKTIDEKLQQQWQFFLKADIVKKLKLSVIINKYLKEADSIFSLLYALNENYDASYYINRYLNYKKEMQKAQSKLVYKIIWDENSKNLASLIKTKLSEKNAIFSDLNYNILIKITTKAKKRKYESTNSNFANLVFALRTTVIKIMNKDAKEISNTVYKTKEGSKISFEDAIQKTTKYEKIIKEMGVMKFIIGI